MEKVVENRKKLKIEEVLHSRKNLKNTSHLGSGITVKREAPGGRPPPSFRIDEDAHIFLISVFVVSAVFPTR